MILMKRINASSRRHVVTWLCARCTPPVSLALLFEFVHCVRYLEIVH